MYPRVVLLVPCCLTIVKRRDYIQGYRVSQENVLNENALFKGFKSP